MKVGANRNWSHASFFAVAATRIRPPPGPFSQAFCSARHESPIGAPHCRKGIAHSSLNEVWTHGLPFKPPALKRAPRKLYLCPPTREKFPQPLTRWRHVRSHRAKTRGCFQAGKGWILHQICSVGATRKAPRLVKRATRSKSTLPAPCGSAGAASSPWLFSCVFAAFVRDAAPTPDTDFPSIRVWHAISPPASMIDAVNDLTATAGAPPCLRISWYLAQIPVCFSAPFEKSRCAGRAELTALRCATCCIAVVRRATVSPRRLSANPAMTSTSWKNQNLSNFLLYPDWIYAPYLFINN